MKKLFLIILAIVMLATTAYAQKKLTVTFIGHSIIGPYVAAQAQIDPMSRDQVQDVLGLPDKSYGFADIWIKHDQIYIGYYNIFGEPVSVVLLPATSW